MNLFLHLVVFLLFGISVVKAQEKGEKAEEPISAALAKARHFVKKKNYGEAIHRFRSCLNLAEKNERTHRLTPVLDALREWHALGEKHPLAREAFVAKRDLGIKKVFQVNEDIENLNEAIPYCKRVQRIVIMNDHLNQPAKSVEIFKAIELKYPKFAEFVDEFFHNALIAEGEYDLVLKYLGDPDSGFAAAKKKYLYWKGRERDGKAGIFAGSFDSSFVFDINRFLKVLYASGEIEHADALRKKALGVVDSPLYFVPVKD